MDKNGIGVDPHVLSLTHGVIEMEQLTPDYGTSRHRLRVTKLRGVRFREGFHDYIIATGGLRVFPRIIAAEHHTRFQAEQVSSGIIELDNLLGGVDTSQITWTWDRKRNQTWPDHRPASRSG
jgi:circadian clock protein KaiC